MNLLMNNPATMADNVISTPDGCDNNNDVCHDSKLTLSSVPSTFERPDPPLRISAVLSSSECLFSDKMAVNKPPLKPKPAVNIHERRLPYMKSSPCKYSSEQTLSNKFEEDSLHSKDIKDVYIKTISSNDDGSSQCKQINESRDGAGIISIEKYFKYSNMKNAQNEPPPKQSNVCKNDDYVDVDLIHQVSDLANFSSFSNTIRAKIGKSYSFCRPLTENINEQNNLLHDDFRSERETVSEEREHNNENRDSRLSKSVDELDKSLLSLLEKDGPYLSPLSHLRMSFIGDLKKNYRTNSICLSNNYSTALSVSQNDDGIYSLPQPQCYGDDTLKAVKVVTEKYDSLQRRKLRALSFREGCISDSPNGSEPSTPVDNTDVINNLCNLENAMLKRETLSAKDIERVDLFYRSRGAEVFVCQCLAEVAFGNVDLSGNTVKWDPPKHTGIPVFVMNSGSFLRKRELHLILAEKGTGFGLFKDKINYLSNYKEVSEKEHTILLNTNLRRCVIFKFHSLEFAKKFFDFYLKLAQDPNDELWKISHEFKPQKPKRSWSFRKIKHKLGPDKKNISHPCNFSHLTSINSNIEQFYESVNNLKSGSESGSETNSCRSAPISR